MKCMRNTYAQLNISIHFIHTLHIYSFSRLNLLPMWMHLSGLFEQKCSPIRCTIAMFIIHVHYHSIRIVKLFPESAWKRKRAHVCIHYLLPVANIAYSYIIWMGWTLLLLLLYFISSFSPWIMKVFEYGKKISISSDQIKWFCYFKGNFLGLRFNICIDSVQLPFLFFVYCFQLMMNLLSFFKWRILYLKINCVDSNEFFDFKIENTENCSV